MRRKFAMAFGGCLTVSAVVLAQQAGQVQYMPPPAPVVQSVQPAVQQAQYLSPFAVTPQPTPPPMSYRAPIRPEQPPAQQIPNNNSYTQVQPVQTYMVTPNGNVTTQFPPTTQGPVIAAPQPLAAPQMAGPQIVPTSSEPMMPAPMPQVQNAPSQQQYIQVQPNGQYVQAQRPTQPTQPSAPVAAQPGQPAAPAQAGTVAPTTNMGNGNQSPCNAGCDACQQNKCSQPCGPDGRVWVSAEYLLWWTSGMSIPPMVTASPNGTPRTAAGVLGEPGTRILWGDNEVNDGIRSGFRLRLGGWFDCCQTCGIEGSYFILNSQPDHYTADCTTSMILARPIFNVSPRQNNNVNGEPIPDSELVCFPGLVNGRVSVDSSTDFTGFDVNFRKNWSCDCCNRIDWLAGFRYLRLDDNLSVSEDLTVEGTNQALPAGSRIQVNDSFQTRNEFYGPQLGLTGEHRRSGGVYVSWRFLLGLGTTHKEATIAGNTTITPAGGVATTYPGGFLALPTNIGRYTKNDFAVVPEIGLNVGYVFSPNVRVFGGYSFIYWSNVTRAGDIVDLTVNTSQLPPGALVGAARPTFQWNDSDFWAQGVSLGVELRY